MSRLGAGLLALVMLVGLALVALPAQPVAAEGLTVTREDDPEPDGCRPDDCSLREAIIAANTDGDTSIITLKAAVYTLEIGIDSEDTDLAESGDLDIGENLQIVGAGAGLTIIDGNRTNGCLGSVFEVHGPVAVTLEDLTIANGCADNDLGESGGALRSTDAGAEITLRRVAVSDNFADRGGGGLYVRGSLRIFDSLLGANNGSSGEGAAVLAGALLLQNSTVSGNGVGVAVAADELTVVSSTITDNDSGIGIPFGLAEPQGSVTLRNSIIAGNADLDCNFAPDPDPVPGVVVSLGHNLDGDGSCQLSGAGDLPNTAIVLGSLQDNGGQTDTHALPASSVAMNKVPVADCLDVAGVPLTADQRGTSRPQGAACDIGAYERAVTPPPPPSGNGGGGGGGAAPQPTPTPTPAPIVAAGAPPAAPVLELRGFTPRGVSLWVLMGGASTADLVVSLADSGADPNGCTIASLVAGRWVVLIPGVQDQRVNAAWTAAFPNGVADGTPLWSRCR